MKKVQFLLFTVIFLAVAAKVSMTPEDKIDYAVLSVDTKLEDVQQFFRYKINTIQSENPYVTKSCGAQTLICCHS